jgi:hypothetical protein
MIADVDARKGLYADAQTIRAELARRRLHRTGTRSRGSGVRQSVANPVGDTTRVAGSPCRRSLA